MNVDCLVVSWEFPNREWNFQEVENALQSAGLPQDALRKLTPVSAFRRACAKLRKDRIILPIKGQDDDKAARFQFNRKVLSEAGYDLPREAVITVERDTGNVTCSTNGSLARHCQMLLLAAIDVRTKTDLTRLLVGMYKDHAEIYAVKRDTGGVYIVPPKHAVFAKQTMLFVQRLGGTPIVLTVDSDGNREVKNSIAEVVAAGTAQVASELEQIAKRWTSSTRDGTMERLIKDWEQAKLKAEGCSALLQTKADGVLRRLELARKKIQEHELRVQRERSAAAH